VFPDGQPHRCHLISISGGLGTTLEDYAERPTLTIQTRGAPNSGGEARDLHAEIDRAWMDAAPGFAVGDYYLIAKGRIGGAAQGTYVRTDDLNRVIRAANYWCEIER
jgi:hypothetical protein